MRIVVDIWHPAQVHLFRHMFEAWRADGHDVLVLARDKDITLALLERYGVHYEVPAPIGRGRMGQFAEVARREAAMFRLVRRFRPDIITGSSPNAARAARLFGSRSVIVGEDDARYIPFFRLLAYPLATAIVAPDVLAYENYGVRHLTYPAYQKLFYLHPNRFTPDRTVLNELGIDAGQQYGIIRLSSLQAHHDAGARGVNEALLRRVFDLAGDRLRLYITSERPLTPEFEPHRLAIPLERIHHAMAFAEFVLGDSQSMTVEAALLGTPAFKFNTFAGIISVLRDIEAYGLAYGYRPGQEDELLAELRSLLDRADRREVFAARRRKMLSEKIDPLPWFLEITRRLMEGETVAEVKAWSTAALAAGEFHSDPGRIGTSAATARA